MDYEKIANEKIDSYVLSTDYRTRLSTPVKNLLRKKYVIDVHTHFFDIKCINKSYFIGRSLKDFVGVKSGGEKHIDFKEEEIYKEISHYKKGWQKELEVFLLEPDVQYKDPTDPNRGLIDIAKAIKLLNLDTMEKVYQYYMDKFSLAKSFDALPNENTLTTALMMDLEMGWETKIDRPMYEKITNLKLLASKYPILPFLACDPRRADKSENTENLYDLFNEAFCKGIPFFGVKIYPALGYDPSDYRLWPIYELCEKYKIPVLSHCGGETVSTGKTDITIYEGETPKRYEYPNRKKIASTLNDPKRWELVLEKFPKLQLNLAHFGGYETWDRSSRVPVEKDPQQRKETIFEFMRKYPNVYADFSFNLVEVKLTSNLVNVLYFDETIRKRTLFGSDFWVVNKDGNLHKEQNRFLNQLGEGSLDINLIELLTFTNPYRYLFGETD